MNSTIAAEMEWKVVIIAWKWLSAIEVRSISEIIIQKSDALVPFPSQEEEVCQTRVEKQ